MEDWARGSLTVCNVHGGAGVLYFWGMNNHGGEATMYPKPIQDLTGWNVRDIGCSNKSIPSCNVTLNISASKNQSSVCARFCRHSFAREEAPETAEHISLSNANSSIRLTAKAARSRRRPPQEVRLLEGIHIHTVACGLGHSVFIARDDTEEERARIRKLPEF
ncbi:hypothetical protein HPB47_015999, partial [Ixodes persulcatus]